MLDGAKKYKYMCFSSPPQRSRPKLTSEGHVKTGNSSLETELPAHLIEDKQSRDLLNPLLHGDESHEVVVELRELVVDSLLEHELVDATGRLVVGHVLHELDLGEELLPLDLGGALPKSSEARSMND